MASTRPGEVVGIDPRTGQVENRESGLDTTRLDGGPWPSTNSQHTSVGTSAIRRFVRPVTWQGAPQEVLPVELTDGYAGIPRRIDGALRMPRG